MKKQFLLGVLLFTSTVWAEESQWLEIPLNYCSGTHDLIVDVPPGYKTMRVAAGETNTWDEIVDQTKTACDFKYSLRNGFNLQLSSGSQTTSRTFMDDLIKGRGHVEAGDIFDATGVENIAGYGGVRVLGSSQALISVTFIAWDGGVQSDDCGNIHQELINICEMHLFLKFVDPVLPQF